MKEFKKIIIEMFSGGNTSIKRVMAFIGFMLLCFTMLVNSFFDENIKPSKELVHSVMYIVMFCIGGNVLEKFKKL